MATIIIKKNILKFKYFISKLLKTKKNRYGELDKMFKSLDVQVWKETDCIECAKCCKKMTPTYTFQDKKRIAQHFKMTIKEFETKWLYKEKGSGDWLNVKRPCQFLDTKTNLCTIYEIRPLDCASFPHHHKKHLITYAPMLKQNIEYCPASYRLIEKMYNAELTKK